MDDEARVCRSDMRQRWKLLQVSSYKRAVELALEVCYCLLMRAVSDYHGVSAGRAAEYAVERADMSSRGGDSYKAPRETPQSVH